ncbi:hypothetical protein ACFL9U_10100, partial [Thermodesulfobacteriota bacterium]
FAIVTGFGCAPTPVKDVYYVMFEKPPGLIDNLVYFKGIEIGEIVDQQVSVLNSAKLDISIKKEYIEMMKRNVVFYITGGQLNYSTVTNYGEPLPVEAKILGFNSKGSLAWFQTKNVMKQSALAASQKAQQLFEGFE